MATKAKRPVGRPAGRIAPETQPVTFRADAAVQAAIARLTEALLARAPGVSPNAARASAIREAILTAAAKVQS